MGIKIQQVVLNKLKNSRKDSLSKKVDLSLVDDIDNEFNYLEESYSEATYAPELFNEWIDKTNDFNTQLSIDIDNFVINGSARGFQEAAEDMQVKIDELEIKAEELGINPSELISNYDEIKNILSDALNAEERMRSAYEELLRETNERFGLANFM